MRKEVRVKQKHKVISVNVPLTLKAWLDEQAKKEQRTLSNMIVHLLEQVRAAQK